VCESFYLSCTQKEAQNGGWVCITGVFGVLYLWCDEEEKLAVKTQKTAQHVGAATECSGYWCGGPCVICNG